MDRHSAYSDLLLRHRSRVWRLCWLYSGGDWERCRDLVQEVSVELWQHFGRLRPNARLYEERAWVTLYTRRTLNHIYRKQSPIYQPLTPEITDNLANPENCEANIAAELVASLPEPDKSIVRMRLEGYSAVEIANLTGLSRDAVYQRLHRTIQRLRSQHEHEQK